MSVVAAILGEASTTYAVTRFAAGSRANGIYTPGATSSVSVLMTVQPASPKEIQVLPEGLRNREIVRCHATTEIRAASRSAGTAGDRFTHNGEVYEFIQVSSRSADGGYWRGLAAMVED